MNNLKIALVAGALATVTKAVPMTAPSMAQSVAERTDGNGNRAKLGSARSGIVYEGDVQSDASDRTMGYGNRAKLGLYRWPVNA